MSELHKAAQRLRDYAWMKINGPMLSPMIFQAFKDMHDVSTAWLSEHLPDDDEPITDEWTESVWGQKHIDISDSFTLFVLQEKKHGKIGVSIDAEGSERGGRCYVLDLPHITTRGQLRRLCKALGVEIKS